MTDARVMGRSCGTVNSTQMDTIGMSAEGNVSVMLGDPRRAIRTMAVPILIALVVTEVNSLADRSWCSGLGADALAAVALCSPLYFVITGLGTGMGVGGAATVSRLIGSGDRDRAASAAYQTLLFSLAFGLVLTLPLVMLCEDILVAIGSGDVTGISCDYMVWIMVGTPVFVMNGAVAGLLRGEGAAKVSTMMMAVTAIVNIILDPVLIYVLDMGIAGASVATVIATTVSTVIGIWYYLKAGYLRREIRSAGPSWTDMRSVLSMGVPQMAEYTVMYAMNLVLNYLVVWCAGSEGLAVYSVPNTVVNLALLPAYAFGSALVPVASAAFGRGDVEKMREGYRYSVTRSIWVVVLLTLVLFLIPEPFLFPFTYSDGTQYLTGDMAEAMRVISLCLPFYAVIPLGASMLQALNLPNWSLAMALARNLVFIAMYAAGAMVSLHWIYWAVVAGSVVGGAMAYVLAARGMRRSGVSPGAGPA